MVIVVGYKDICHFTAVVVGRVGADDCWLGDRPRCRQLRVRAQEVTVVQARHVFIVGVTWSHVGELLDLVGKSCA